MPDFWSGTVGCFAAAGTCAAGTGGAIGAGLGDMVGIGGGVATVRTGTGAADAGENGLEGSITPKGAGFGVFILSESSSTTRSPGFGFWSEAA